MKILSLFDGISCARVALERAGIEVDQYYASEIDQYAISISKKNWPNNMQLGDVSNIIVIGGILRIDKKENLDIPITNSTNFDLLIGGSPCQDLSIAKKDRKGLAGERSGLFWEYLRILKEVKPKYFILENVARMSIEDEKIISNELGVKPILIDANLVSAQDRPRLFWVGIRNDFFETMGGETILYACVIAPTR